LREPTRQVMVSRGGGESRRQIREEEQKVRKGMKDQRGDERPQAVK